jgi:predicted lipoprotein with Yx(FWY)xxD motif
MPSTSGIARGLRRPARVFSAFGLAAALVILAAYPSAALSTPHAKDPQLSVSHDRSLTSSAVVVKATKHGKLGMILETSAGYTLYRFTLDTAKKLACTGGCIQAWPPLLLPKGVTHATAGSGVKQSLLGTRKRGTSLQVTYKGLPLYRYAADTGPGQTTGQGVGGTWFVVKA